MERTRDEDQELELLAKIVQGMPRRARQVLTMRKTYGLSLKEISEKLGVSLLVVEGYLEEAAIALADGLTGERSSNGAGDGVLASSLASMIQTVPRKSI